MAAIVSGCTPTAQEEPSAASSSIVLTAEESRTKRTLDDAERVRVIEAMKIAAPDHEPTRRATAAEHGVRWSDLSAAVAAACADIEAAVTRTVVTDDGDHYRFALRTIEDWPGELVVDRVEPPAVYTARASIGRFAADAGRRERADALLVALDRWMQAFGRKRQYPDDAR